MDTKTTSSPASTLTLGCVVVSALAARWVLMGALHGALQLLDMPFLPPEVDLGLAGAAVALAIGIPTCAVATMGILWLRGRPGWTVGLGLGTLAIVSMIGANHMRHLDGFYRMQLGEGNERGTYPHHANSERTYSRCGVSGTAHINGDGYRVCEPPGVVQQGEQVVTLVGDSMVFGQAVPDDGSLCWALREDLEVLAPGRFVFRNLGQPGANIRSYGRMLRFVDQEFGTDLFVVGLLVPNDSMVHDVNQLRPSRDSLGFQVLAAALQPHTVMAAGQMWDRVGRSEFFSYLSLTTGLDELAAAIDEVGVPTLVFMYDSRDGYQVREGGLQPFVDHVEALAASHPLMDFAGVLSITEDVDRYILCDGHPTSEGHGRHAEMLQPTILSWAAP